MKNQPQDAPHCRPLMQSLGSTAFLIQIQSQPFAPSMYQSIDVENAETQHQAAVICCHFDPEELLQRHLNATLLGGATQPRDVLFRSQL